VLELKNLHVALEDGTEIVKRRRPVREARRGACGHGAERVRKSTLAYALMGHPAYEITEGELLLDGENILEMEADERAQRGLFLAFQYPHAVPGVTVTSFLRSAINAVEEVAERRRGQPDPDS
jgi:Fe-S cluster assembly ATP-binding protein